ncbi:hypothetical protein EX011_21370 [Salmonella enterica]|nr:hypothetical protein [Salmonella enterica]EAW2493079.1 hypothetical protein [Salmonella enterica subsp. enterica]HAV7961454.1 hypothetical protein [Escherichia coli]EBL7042075.1 hypothetical protein [Salmonella enterica]EHQ9605802.1 hypothetical protein [Salmonella enterica]
MKQNRNVRSGNQIKVLFDGKQIGLIQSLSCNDDYAPEPASGIGDIHVQEYVPTMARHSLSVSAMLLNKSQLQAAGIVPENGDAVLQGLVFDIEQYDNLTGVLLRKYTGVSYASGSIETTKHAIVTSSAQFNALDVFGDGT